LGGAFVGCQGQKNAVQTAMKANEKVRVTLPRRMIFTKTLQKKKSNWEGLGFPKEKKKKGYGCHKENWVEGI